jgi:hypothetical protein
MLEKWATRRVAPTFFEFGGTGFQPVPHRLEACATIFLVQVGREQTVAAILSGKPMAPKRKRRKTLASQLASS